MASFNIADLNRRFGLDGIASVVSGNGDFAKVVVATPKASGEMYLHGGHVTSWKPSDTGEMFYLSPNALFRDGSAIRGGVPVCFPWFGDKADDPAAPAHGFVRTKEWRLESLDPDGGNVVVTMSTQNDDNGREWWPHDFLLVCRATFGIEFRLELIVTNTDRSVFTFEEALHAYFAVKDAESATVRGLDATRYLDKTDRRVEKMQTGDVHFSAETDRVYLDTTRALELFDRAGKRSIRVEKQNSYTTVIWNPWYEKSIALKDLGADEWKKFVCVETTNVIPLAVTLEPGQSHTMALIVQASR